MLSPFDGATHAEASPVCSGEQTFTCEHDEPGPNNFDGNPAIYLGSNVRKLLRQIGGEVVSAALVIVEAVRLSLLAPRLRFCTR
jgi:hypothetical protein